MRTVTQISSAGVELTFHWIFNYPDAYKSRIGTCKVQRHVKCNEKKSATLRRHP